jgi:hypothetical protein
VIIDAHQHFWDRVDPRFDHRWQDALATGTEANPATVFLAPDLSPDGEIPRGSVESAEVTSDAIAQHDRASKSSEHPMKTHNSPSNGAAATIAGDTRWDGRAAEGAGLENRFGACLQREFESHSHRLIDRRNPGICPGFSWDRCLAGGVRQHRLVSLNPSASSISSPTAASSTTLGGQTIDGVTGAS